MGAGNRAGPLTDASPRVSAQLAENEFFVAGQAELGESPLSVVYPAAAARGIGRTLSWLLGWERRPPIGLPRRPPPTADSMFHTLMRWTKLTDPPETDIVDELQDAAKRPIVIVQHGYTLFNDEGGALVEDKGWTDLVFCGIDTESCVLKSAVDAFEASIRTWILTDASASHSDQAGHDAGLLVARRFIGSAQLITVADLADRADV